MYNPFKIGDHVRLDGKDWTGMEGTVVTIHRLSPGNSHHGPYGLFRLPNESFEFGVWPSPDTFGGVVVPQRGAVVDAWLDEFQAASAEYAKAVATGPHVDHRVSMARQRLARARAVLKEALS